MLLKRCFVQGFGKLQDFTYEFTEGLNIICAENGWGKSTFAAFLRAMFYGLPQAGSRTKLEEAERRRYRPWNGGVMGGSLVFEVDGKEYKVERTFGKKEAEDTFRLIDLSTNLDSTAFSPELGKELFGLDKEAYSRSTYLPQNKVSDGGMNDSIRKKLGRMAEGEEDGGNFDKAYESLEELRKKYIPDRQKDEKGYVAELTRSLSDAQARLEACRRKEESAKPWREKEQKAMAERKALEAALSGCRERLEAAAGYEALAAKKQHYTELCANTEGLRVKRESTEGLFAAGVPELSELRRCRQDAEEAAELAGELRSYRLGAAEQSDLEVLRQRFVNGVPEEEEIQACIRLEGETKEELLRTEQLWRGAEEKGNRTKKLRKRCMGLAVLFFVLAVGFGLFAFCRKGETKTRASQAAMEQENVQKENSPAANKAMLGLSGAFGLASLVLLITGIGKKKEEEEAARQQATYSKDLKCLQANRERGKELLARYGEPHSTDVTGDLYRLSEEARRYGVLSEKRSRFEQCTKQQAALLQHCTELLTRYGMETEDVGGNLHILENRTRDFLRISEEFADAVKKREQFEQETPPESFYGLTVPEISFAQLQRREQELLVRIAAVSEEEKDCRRRAEAFEEEAEACGELEEVCAETAERLEAKKREHFFITETIKCLRTAKEQFSSRYLRGLTTGFETYMSLLGEEDLKKSTDGYFGGVRTDVNLNVQVTAYGEEKELGYFSTGVRDFIGLCMRFALVDALFAEEQPFLVLDDPFVNLDKEKLNRAVRFLKEAAKRYQILYLVCHESRI